MWKNVKETTDWGQSQHIPRLPVSRFDLDGTYNEPPHTGRVTTPTIETYFQWWYSCFPYQISQFSKLSQSFLGAKNLSTTRFHPSNLSPPPRRAGDSWPVPSDILPAVGRAESRRWSFADAPLATGQRAGGRWSQGPRGSLPGYGWIWRAKPETSFWSVWAETSSLMIDGKKDTCYYVLPSGYST